jgi:DNA-directed RNA polymerase subunit RPC12/RpoP
MGCGAYSNNKMDIFDNPILCKKCRKEMKKTQTGRDGFLLRAVECPKCKSKVLHPTDEAEYGKFKKLRDKTYRVKMRIVGNSYAVSIPREIVNFIKDQERIMNDMVKLCFNDSKRLSLFFGDENEN